MSFGDADLAVMLGDAFSVPVTFGVVSTSGIVGFHDLELLDDDGGAAVIGRQHAVSLLTSVCATLTPGTAITVDGTAYTVREKLAQQDGKTTLVFLRG